MEIYAAPRGQFFWSLTVMAFVNIVLAALFAVHHRDPWERLPLLTVLLAVVMIWAVSARLQNGLSKVSREADEKAGVRLLRSAQTLAFMANLAILSSLSVLH